MPRRWDFRRLLHRNENYHRVFSTPEGEAMLADLAASNFLLQTTAVAGDPVTSAFNEGRRAAVLDVLQRLRWSEAELRKLADQRTTEAVNDE